MPAQMAMHYSTRVIRRKPIRQVGAPLFGRPGLIPLMRPEMGGIRVARVDVQGTCHQAFRRFQLTGFAQCQRMHRHHPPIFGIVRHQAAGIGQQSRFAPHFAGKSDKPEDAAAKLHGHHVPRVFAGMVQHQSARLGRLAREQQGHGPDMPLLAI